MKCIFIVIMALLLSTNISVKAIRRRRRTKRSNAAVVRRATDSLIKLKCADIEKNFPADTCPSCPMANYVEYSDNTCVVDFWKEHCAPLYKKYEKMIGLQVICNILYFFVIIYSAYTLFTSTSR